MTEHEIDVGISQESSILYLFYNADLLEACNNLRLRTSVTEFVDDVSILIYSTSTKENCRNIEKMYEAVEE